MLQYRLCPHGIGYFQPVHVQYRKQGNKQTDDENNDHLTIEQWRFHGKKHIGFHTIHLRCFCHFALQGDWIVEEIQAEKVADQKSDCTSNKSNKDCFQHYNKWKSLLLCNWKDKGQGRDPKHLGGDIGFMAILHTWGYGMIDHPHLHCVVPGGGLSEDEMEWITPKKSKKRKK